MRRAIVPVVRGLLGVGLIGLILGSGSPAPAGTIRVTGGGIAKVGDPFYQYIVKVYLEDDYEMRLGDYFTLHALGGIDTTSLYSAPQGSPSGPWATQITFLNNGPLPQHSPDYTVPFSDARFINSGPDIANNSGGEIFLGTFIIQTWQSLPFLWEPQNLAIRWSAHLHQYGDGPVDDSGVVLLSLIVPEPASVVLLGVGLVVPALLCRRERMRMRMRMRMRGARTG